MGKGEEGPLCAPESELVRHVTLDRSCYRGGGGERSAMILEGMKINKNRVISWKIKLNLLRVR